MDRFGRDDAGIVQRSARRDDFGNASITNVFLDDGPAVPTVSAAHDKLKDLNGQDSIAGVSRMREPGPIGRQALTKPTRSAGLTG